MICMSTVPIYQQLFLHDIKASDLQMSDNKYAISVKTSQYVAQSLNKE